MNYSLWIAKDWFEKKGINLSYRISETGAGISQFIYRDTYCFSDDSKAQIVNGDDLSDCSGFRSAICFANDRLLFPTATPEQVYNLCIEMTEYYDRLEMKFLEEALIEKSPILILEKISSTMNVPLALLVNKNAVLFRSSSFQLPLNQVHISKMLQKLSRNKSASFSYFPDWSRSSHSIVLIPFDKEQKNSFILLFNVANEKLKPGDLDLFLAIKEFVSNLFSLKRMPLLHPLSKWFDNCINNTASVEALNDNMLEMLHWKQEDLYQICHIYFSGSHHLLHQYIQELSDNNHCCIKFADGLSVLIHRTTPDSASITEDDPLLLDFTKKHPVLAGYSLPYRSLENTTYFHQQAVSFINAAPTSQHSSFHMLDYLPEHILRVCRSLPDVQVYIHPEIQHLAELVKSEREPLLDTLYTYLVLGRSAAHTANALFIHRNTLHTRLEKIQNYLSFSIDNDPNIEHILISLILLQNNNG